jgi:23S rRNA pseudouridine955/2504/2580 synthase
VGDDKYGDDIIKESLARQGFNRMFLHAHSLAFAHPVTGERLELQAPLPAACVALLKQLESA